MNMLVLFKLDTIDWDFVSVLLDLLNCIIITAFGVLTFLFYKIKRIKIIIIDDDGGKDVIIQNISKNTLFIKDLNLIICSKESRSKQIISFNEFAHDLPDDIVSKGYYKFSIDYSVLGIKPTDRIKVKIDIYNNYSYIRKVK